MKKTKIIITALMLHPLILLSSLDAQSRNISATRINPHKEVYRMSVKKSVFGKMPDGREVDLYTLTNSNGMQVKITNYGGIITSIITKDKNNAFDDVVLGYDTLKEYLDSDTYFGAIIGRYANRIANGKFNLNGKEYNLAKNNGENHLHGGIKGFDKVLWNASSSQTNSDLKLVLKYKSNDGEEGYPGNLKVRVTYTLTNDNELKIDYFSVTDKPTIVNLTNHSYFNLSGAGNGNILKHILSINANKFTPVNKNLIPTGEIRFVKDTTMDFITPTEIGSRINQKDEQLIFGKGYDHNWVLNKLGKELSLAAELYDPNTGRDMDVYTTEPGLQFYSGNFLQDNTKGKEDKNYNYRGGLCLEAQHFPDSPNHKNFPSVTLKPKEKYTQTTVYKFTTR